MIECYCDACTRHLEKSGAGQYEGYARIEAVAIEPHRLARLHLTVEVSGSGETVDLCRLCLARALRDWAHRLEEQEKTGRAT